MSRKKKFKNEDKTKVFSGKPKLKDLHKKILGHLKGDIYIHREGNGTPLQYSCLENPMDGGAR